MTLNSQLIDEVVRNVMRELDLSQASPAAVPTSGLPPTSAPVELTQRVITEDVFVLRAPAGHAGADSKLRHTGYIPVFTEELIEEGFLDVEVFT